MTAKTKDPTVPCMYVALCVLASHGSSMSYKHHGIAGAFLSLVPHLFSFSKLLNFSLGKQRFLFGSWCWHKLGSP